MRHYRGLHVTVLSMTPRVDGKFLVHVGGGGHEWWTIDDIKRAVALGANLTSSEKAAA